MFQRNLILFVAVSLLAALAGAPALGAGIVPPGTTTLADSGSAGSPALWWLDGDYTSPAGSTFTIGAFGVSWNHLTVDDGHTFVASDGMVVGPHNGAQHRLFVEAGSLVQVNGNLICGQSTSIAYYSRNQGISVSGPGARLQTTGALRIGIGSAWLVTDNTLRVSDGGVVVVGSDQDAPGVFSLANHWSYGNSWLELQDGLVAIWGNAEAQFAYGSGILSSIKVYDPQSETMQRVAAYSGTEWYATSYLDLLAVDYVADLAQAAELGIPREFVGYTVLYDVPEPAGALLLTIGAGAALRRRR